jgi:hypothetical protein
VPRFWLRVLRSADAAALAVTARDAAVLACLADVRFSLRSNVSSEDSSSVMKELHGKRELLHQMKLHTSLTRVFRHLLHVTPIRQEKCTKHGCMQKSSVA